MHVVLDTPDDDGLAVEIRENAAEVAVEFVPQQLVAQERPTIFGGEDGMDQDLGEGLGHAETMWNAMV